MFLLVCVCTGKTFAYSRFTRNESITAEVTKKKCQVREQCWMVIASLNGQYRCCLSARVIAKGQVWTFSLLCSVSLVQGDSIDPFAPYSSASKCSKWLLWASPQVATSSIFTAASLMLSLDSCIISVAPCSVELSQGQLSSTLNYLGWYSIGTACYWRVTKRTVERWWMRWHWMVA